MNDSSVADSRLYHQAINAALDNKWEDAIKLNRQIIKIDPSNVDALNRQAKAYLELGRCNLAKKYYTLALKFDPYNPIALKNLKIIKSFKLGKQKNSPAANGNAIGNHTRLSPSLFLQEPGKTKIVNLLKVTEPQKLSHVYCGMKVETVIKNRKIIVTDSESKYLGVLPDDMSHLLIKLLRGGSKYELFVKSIRVNSLSVLIRETFRSKRFKNQPSFLDTTNFSVNTDIITSFDNDEPEEVSDDGEESDI